MSYVFGMKRGIQFFCRNATYNALGPHMFCYDCTGSYARFWSDIYIVDNAYTGSDIDVVAYMSSFVCSVWADSGELSDIHIIAYHGITVDDGTEAVLYVETVAYNGTRRNQKSVMLFIAAKHEFAKWIEPSTVLRESEPYRKAHTGAGKAAYPNP